MLFQPPIYHQNKGEGVQFYSAISTYICLYYLCVLLVFVFVCIYLHINTYKCTKNYKYTYKYKKLTHDLFSLSDNTADYLLILANSKDLNSKDLPEALKYWVGVQQGQFYLMG